MPTNNIRFQDKDFGFGYRPGETWGDTGVTLPGTGERLRVKEFTPPTLAPEYHNDSMEAGAGGVANCAQFIRFGASEASVTVDVYRDDAPILQLYALALGGVYSSTTPESGVRLHNIPWAPSIVPADVEKLIAAFTYAEGEEYKGMYTCLVSDFTETIDTTVTGQFTLTGPYVSITAAPTTTLGSVCGGGVFTMPEVKVYMNNESDGALGPSDEVKVTSYEITSTAGYTSGEYESGDAFPSLPTQDENREFTVTLNFKKKDTTNAAYFAAWIDVTLKKIKIEITGPVIPTKTSRYVKTWYMPSMMISDITYDAATPTPTSVTLTVMRAASNPAGMSSRLPYMTWQNTQAALVGLPT